MKGSVVQGHFPQVSFEHGKKRLFNPVLRKRYENRPEERVRLRWTEYLLLEAGWKRSRIAFEAAVRNNRSGSTLRADLILYDEALHPEILIECKSESEELKQAVAEQAGRYNREVEAPFIILTNGHQDLCYRREKGEIAAANPPFSSSGNRWREKPGYWSARGFCPESHDHQGGWIPALLNRFWDSSAIPTYLDVDLDPDIPAGHYYRIWSLPDEEKLAVTFTGCGISDCWLLALLSCGKENARALALSIRKMEENHPANGTLYDQSGKSAVNGLKILSLPVSSEPDEIALFTDNLPGALRSFF